MITKLAVLMLVVLNCGAVAAEETLAPPTEEVARAYIAARDVGNVDAAMAFFTADAVFQLTGGKKFTKDELRKLHELFAHEHVHTYNLKTVAIKDQSVTLTNNVSTRWLTQFGFPGILVYEIMQVDGNRLTSVIGYYPRSSLDKMDQACRDKPEVMVPTRPCAEVIPVLRAHTERLIADGVAERE